MTVTTILRGGIGNCLFGIGAVLGYSLKHGCDYCIPSKITYPHSEDQEVFYSPRLKYCEEPQKGVACVYTEHFFHYQEIPQSKCDRLILNGYFQSYKYFQDYRNEILTLLNIPKVIGYGKIFLHYRMGDYKTLFKFHKIISDTYIDAALQMVYQKGYRDIIVFSDEIEYAKEKFKGELFNWQYSEGKTEVEDLILMANCAGGIMSASSFSWWGAWLGNQDRLIVYPKDWFGPELNHDTKDLCPENWIAI